MKLSYNTTHYKMVYNIEVNDVYNMFNLMVIGIYRPFI